MNLPKRADPAVAETALEPDSEAAPTSPDVAKLSGTAETDLDAILSGTPLPPEEQDEACSVVAIPTECQIAEAPVFYDIGLGRCEKFSAGNCGASENTFESMQDCVDACGEPHRVRHQ